MGQRADDLSGRQSKRGDVWGPDPPPFRAASAQRDQEATREAEPSREVVVALTPAAPNEEGAPRGAASPPTEEQGESAEIGQIRAGIEQTRAELSGTVDAIQERLDPQHLVEQAKDAAKEATSNLAEDARVALREATVGKAEQMITDANNTARGALAGVVDSIKANPIPAALAGIGLGWLYMNSRPGGRYRAYEYTGGDVPEGYPAALEQGDTGRGVSRVQEMAGETIDSARGRVGQLASDAGGAASEAGEKAGRLVTNAGSTAKGASSTLWASIRERPAAAVLTGVGVAWLLRGQDIASGVSYLSRPPAGSSARSAAQDATERARAQVEDATERARAQIDEVGTEAQATVRRAQGQLQRVMHETPLAVGAAAFGLGAAVGLAVPSTPQESQLMGEARDALVEKTQQAAQDAQKQIQAVGQQALQAAREQATEPPAPESPAQNAGLPLA